SERGGTVTVRPRAYDEAGRGAMAPLDLPIMCETALDVRVVPASEYGDRYVGKAIVIAFRVQAGLTPVIGKPVGLPLLEQVTLVVRRRGERGVTRSPRHVPEPAEQRSLAGSVRLRVRHAVLPLERVPARPRRL